MRVNDYKNIRKGIEKELRKLIITKNNKLSYQYYLWTYQKIISLHILK
jgi:hypothetical protein